MITHISCVDIVRKFITNCFAVFRLFGWNVITMFSFDQKYLIKPRHDRVSSAIALGLKFYQLGSELPSHSDTDRSYISLPQGLRMFLAFK